VVCLLHNFHKTEETLLRFSNIEKQSWRDGYAKGRAGKGKTTNSTLNGRQRARMQNVTSTQRPSEWVTLA
jgi:hypothetical protein